MKMYLMDLKQVCEATGFRKTAISDCMGFSGLHGRYGISHQGVIL